MKGCKTHLVRMCVFLLAAVPAYCQRGTFGINVGQTSDKFDSLSSESGLTAGIDGELAVIKGNAKENGPSVIAGGEMRIPSDTGKHAKEYALFGGPRFHAGALSVGFNVQVRKIVLPTAEVNNQFFDRNNLRLLELPVVLKYNFGSNKRTFIEVQGAPEFTPHYQRPSSAKVILPDPRFDHGYFIRGSLGYIFGKWYAKGTYENRYFKFVPDQGNPSNLYNWKSNLISGGIGFAF